MSKKLFLLLVMIGIVAGVLSAQSPMTNNKKDPAVQNNGAICYDYADTSLKLLTLALQSQPIDTNAFHHGLQLMDSVCMDGAVIEKFQSQADAFIAKNQHRQASLIMMSIYYRLMNSHELFKAVAYGNRIIDRFNKNDNPFLKELTRLILYEMRIPYRTSEQLNDGFKRYTDVLKEYLIRNDSMEISICYFVLRSFYSTKGLNELAVFYSKKALKYCDSTDRLVNDFSVMARYRGRSMWSNLHAVLGGHYTSLGNYNDALNDLKIALADYTANPPGERDSMNILFCNYEICVLKLLLNDTVSIKKEIEYLNAFLQWSNEPEHNASVYLIKGQYYYAINQLDLASDNLLNCIGLMKKYNLPVNSIVDYLIPNYHLAQVRVKQKRFKEAVDLLNEEIPNLIGMNDILLDDYRLLLESYMNLGDVNAVKSTYALLTDLQNKFLKDEKENRALSFELEEKIKEAENTITSLENSRKITTITRNSFIGFSVLLLVTAIVLYNRFRITSQQKVAIEAEKQRSDALLLNILPADIAEELKRKGASEARNFDLVTVMFTDFKNFTHISEQMSPASLLKEINYCFSAFDNIIQKYSVEKIKTIGDAYMCAGGLPIANESHALDAVSAAIEITSFMHMYNRKRVSQNELPFEIRIGINTGPVVAGIVGVKKFAYDIWGDTVNTAARMEQHSEPGRINISGATYELVKHRFACTYRGKVEAKNKGEIDMYFVS